MTDIATEIAALDDLTTGELAEQYEQLHGQPCRTRHRAYLIRKVAWRMQAHAEGDLSERARRIRQRAAELADDADVRVMPPRRTIRLPQDAAVGATTRTSSTADKAAAPRLPAVGCAIVRKYKGRTHRVVVLGGDEGFEYEGERYRTLTAVAKHITGSHINGFRFFQLGAKP